ncbi:STAS domain-containing protein [Paracoccus ravus]|uniref:STAS domain-containing protein n=1 Tax=Paracoccus ravus TaxID=2447760 RepID=UPI00106DFDEE|nr:STAS domain-containing protein [Paracoccus ravus]
MQLNLFPQSDGVTIQVDERRIDAAIALAFKDRIRSLVAHGGDRVVLDLSAVEFMDSSGLGAIIAIYKSMPAGRSFSLIGLTPNVERVFRLTRMDSVIAIRPASDTGQTAERRVE